MCTIRSWYAPCHLNYCAIPSVPGTPDPDKPTPDTTIPVPELNFTTPSDLAPDITPCENPYIYRIYKATSYDCMAIENTETLVVEVYKWYPDAESDGIVRDHRVLSQSDFQQFEFYDDFYFVGFTLASKLSIYMPSKQYIAHQRQ